MQDDSFDRLLRQRLSRDATEGVCPDPSLLAAFADGALSQDERRDLQAHASACARCSAELTLLATTADVPGPQPAPSAGRRFPVPWRWAVPLATAVLVFVVWTETERREPQNEPTTAKPAASAPAGGESVAQRSVPDGLTAPPPPVEPSKAAPAGDRGLAKREQPAPVAEPGRAQGYEPSSTDDDTVGGTLEESERQSKAAAATPPAGQPDAQPRAPAPLASTDAARERRSEAPAEEDRAPVPAAPEESAANAETVQLEAAQDPAAHELRRDAVPDLVMVEAPDGVRVRVSAAGIERSTDGGTTWQREREAPPAAIRLGVCLNAAACWLGGDAGLILRREPSGRWVESRLPVRATVIRLDAQDAARATATLASGRRFATADGGRTWSPLP